MLSALTVIFFKYQIKLYNFASRYS